MRVMKALTAGSTAAFVAASLLAVTAGGAMAASSIYLCIGEKAGQGVKSGGTTGTCPAVTEKQKVVYVPVALPKEAAEQQTLLSILSHAKFIESGIGGKPTIRFSGVNVQIVNGEGTSTTTNGEGNLVLGYDETPGTQTGSHNLVVGDRQTFTSFGGLVAGIGNTISSKYATVVGGQDNVASGEASAVSGGVNNRATELWASVSGGDLNSAGGVGASVQGGEKNAATGSWSSIFGGKSLTASNAYEAIP